ncbi:hypothetical protein MAR_035824 [Mya arenaria]|uniref:Cadherin domain-containing protein n=1 Tax=Mya arenaria TaxID=6604 RepID=A0ABY7EQ97_MYAAR|nr:hypothetical protein MAR_035824 [Mya arenaria]
MDLRMFAACLIMTVFLSKHSGGTLFTALATPNTATYAFDTTDGNPSDIATATISAAGVVTLASSFDFETTPSYVFKIVATDGGDTGTATVTLSITDSVQLTKTAFCLSSSSVAAGTSVGTITTDETAVTYRGLCFVHSFYHDWAITVATGVTLSSAKQVYYTFTMTATTTTSGVGASGTQNIYVLVNCDSDSSGAGQVAALFSMLLLSIATALLY